MRPRRIQTDMRAAVAALVLTVGAGATAGCAGSRLISAAPPPPTRAQQIELARGSNRLFSIFPAKPGQKKCGIPEGGVHFKPLPGFCATSIEPGNGKTRPTIVSFTEKWLDPPCPPGRWCVLETWRHHTWRVSETNITSIARVQVGATFESGAAAPQYYK